MAYPAGGRTHIAHEYDPKQPASNSAQQAADDSPLRPLPLFSPTSPADRARNLSSIGYNRNTPHRVYLDLTGDEPEPPSQVSTFLQNLSYSTALPSLTRPPPSLRSLSTQSWESEVAAIEARQRKQPPNIYSGSASIPSTIDEGSSRPTSTASVQTIIRSAELTPATSSDDSASSVQRAPETYANVGNSVESDAAPAGIRMNDGSHQPAASARQVQPARPSSQTREAPKIRVETRDGVPHVMRQKSGVFLEVVDGITVSTQKDVYKGTDSGPDMSIPEVEARDIRKIPLPSDNQVESLYDRGRQHQARSPPPVRQNRSLEDHVRRISPRPATKPHVHRLVDRNSSYAGTRLHNARNHGFDLPEHEPASWAEMNETRDREEEIVAEDGAPAPIVPTEPQEDPQHNDRTSWLASKLRAHDLLPSKSTGDAQSFGGTVNPKQSSAARMPSPEHPPQHENTSSGLAHRMQEKIERSAQAIEENLPWNKKRDRYQAAHE